MAKKKRSRSKPTARAKQPSMSPLVRGVLTAFLTAFTFMIAVKLAATTQSLRSVTPPLADTLAHNARLYQQFNAVGQNVTQYEQQQLRAEIQVVPDAKLDQQLASIQIAIESGHSKQAATALSNLQQSIDADQVKLAQAIAAAREPSNPGIPESQALTVPILLYHYPPPDLNLQLDTLQNKNYTTITPDQLADALHGVGQPLPTKPVLITFDDGYANQMTAFADLKQHHMHATFYIITGGVRSRWCIGANRRYNDPLQPPTGCGDAYLNWSQIQQLDASGLITIGAHTVDHESLPTDSPAIQHYEILASKQALEAHLHHAVDSFAYPYGNYNDTTVSIVEAAGFRTAVTTRPGITQTLGDIYTLFRARDARQLP